MSYLFLSYSKRDKKFAQNISSLLQKAGSAVWLDENPRELTAHEWPIIEENIRNAAAFVLLVSESAKQSAWIKRELDFAESIEKPIFPILIEGNGWSRLTIPLETLELGISLSLPDSLSLKLKALQLSPLPVELPPQIPSHSINYKRGRAKQSFLLWLGIMATMVLAVVIAAPLVVATINYGENVAASQDAVNAATETSFHESYWETRQSNDAQATQEREDFLQESRQTRTQEQLDEEATATARNQTRVAAATQASLMQNTQVLASATQQANYNLTAIAGNGQLPCKAFVYLVDASSDILVYRKPSLSLNPSLITRREAQEFIVVEWLANDDGYWYRIGTETQYSVGYVQPESLVLDTDCPR